MRPSPWLACAAVVLAGSTARGEAWLAGAHAASALDHLEVWPGAAVAPGFRAELGGAWPFHGSGLSVQMLRLQQGRRVCAWACAFEQWRSEVHVQSEAAAALQVRRGGWQAGVAAGARELRFDRYAPWRATSLRVGAGGWARRTLHASAAWHWRQHGQPVLSAAAVWRASRLELSLQVEREPALPSRWRTGAAWGADGPVGLLCGYDIATAAITSGVTLVAGAWRLAWAGLAHAELGWSHTWILSYGR